jgi:hypothetical protein
MVAEVSDGKLTGLRPDAEHPITAGFSCPKGLEFVHVQNDDDRVLHPLRRHADGTFVQISWDTALREIGQRLRAVRDAHGGESIGMYVGNPSAFSHSHAIWATGFLKAIGSRHLYSPNTQDTSSRFVASALLYGNPVVLPVPDVERSDLVLLLGTNPLVSRGSLMSAGNVREKLSGVVSRGGRVVVVDPRRTETARAFEHVAVRPDGDAGLAGEVGQARLDLLLDLGADRLVAVVDVLHVAGDELTELVRLAGQHVLDAVLVTEQLLELLRRRGGDSGVCFGFWRRGFGCCAQGQGEARAQAQVCWAGKGRRPRGP